MKNRIVRFLTLSVAVIAFFSCDSGRVLDKYAEIPGSVWNKDSLVYFQFHAADTLDYHDIYIQLRNQTSYQYSNLWLFIEIEQPGGKVLRDTLEVVLALPSGKWVGEGFGGLKTVKTLYRSNVFFPVPGEYTISLQQGMRNELLKGIHDIGIRIEKVSGSE